MRLEYLMAMSDWRASNGKTPFKRFLRYHDEPSSTEPETDLEKVAQMFGMPYEVKKRGR